MYIPNLLLFQKNHSEYLVFEDSALKYANLNAVHTSTVKITNSDSSIDVTIDINNANGIHVDSPYNGFQATILTTDLGNVNTEQIPDDIYTITYTYSYSIDTINYAGSITRRFALYARLEYLVTKLIHGTYLHYNYDKPYANEYVKKALEARALLKSLEVNAFMGFEDEYFAIKTALEKLLL
jgi:hypothetical protein